MSLNKCPIKLFPKCIGIALHSKKNKYPCLYMEKYEKTIYAKKYPNQVLIKKHMHCLINALIYMQNRGILHRDIKGSNILEKNNDITLTDFNICKFNIFSKKKNRDNIPYKYSNKNSSDAYTVTHRPIELLLGTPCHGTAADVWAAGICFLEMCIDIKKSFYSYDDLSEIGVIFKIFKLLGTPTEKTWPGLEKLPHFKKTWPKWSENKVNGIVSNLDGDGKDLLKKMIIMNPDKRITLKQITEHPFFTDLSFVEPVLTNPLDKIKLMDKHKVTGKMINISKKIRKRLVTWMLNVQNTFDLKIETYFSSILLLDIFMTKINIHKNHLQLFACACMNVMSSIYETQPASTSDWVHISANKFNEHILNQMSLIVCSQFKYDLFFSTHWTWALGYLDKFANNVSYLDLLDNALYFLLACVQSWDSYDYSLEELGRSAAIFALNSLEIKHDLEPICHINKKDIDRIKKILGGLNTPQ